jgi:2-aminoethylphosphonate transport system ATP-binding protein
MTSAVLGAEAASARVAAQTLAADSTVRFDAVTVAYRGAVVLKPLTLDIAAGEILAMIALPGQARRRREGRSPASCDRLRGAFTSAQPT